MGMTIDDCIKELLINKEDDTFVLGNETIDFAIDTMRKYEKIQQILKDIPYGDGAVVWRIQEVIEDGTN